MPQSTTTRNRSTAAKRTRIALDIDKRLDDETEDVETTPPVTVKVFGEEFKVSTAVNSFLVYEADAGDSAALIRLIEALIMPEDYDRFLRALRAQKGVTNERLLKLVGGLYEASAARPTK